jgi:aspartate aminotransferase/aminotransferase
MTGWRLGYALASTEIATMMARLAEPFVSSASSLSQKAGEAALAGSQDVVRRMREGYRRRRDLVVDLLQPEGLLAVVPRGAFYALVDLSSVSMDSMLLARQLLEEQRVASAPGETLGHRGRGLVRISFAAERSRLEEGCRRIVRFARSRVGADRRAQTAGR